MNHKLIVIDTNILISAALSPDGTAHKALSRLALKIVFMARQEAKGKRQE